MGYTIAALEAELPGQEMNDLITEILAASLKSVGLRHNGAAAPYYERWLNSSIRYLQEQGVLADDLTFRREVRPLADLWAEWEGKRAAWATNPNQQAQSTLLSVCLQALPAILSGTRRATDVMFPNSSMHLVEGIYRGNPQANYFNEILGETLRACIEQLLQGDQERKIRLLEIGAGTGGTTATLLPILQRYPIEEYCYTDLSKAFLMYGEKSFRPEFPALTTAIFDVSKPLETQTVNPHHYDFVIAANVLHATSNIRETLRNAKAALKNQGVLLLNEIAAWSLFNHLTFGLLEGWWLYEDTAVRLPGSPGLSPEKWREILAQEGFESIIFPAKDAHHFGQQIVAAVSNGWTRQRIVPRAVDCHPERSRGTWVDGGTSTAPSTRPAPSTGARDDTRNYTRRIVTEKVSEALKMDAAAIPGDASFADFGVDSIVGVNLVRNISEALQIELETTSLFEYSTIDDLTEYILKNWKDQIAAQAQGVVPQEPAPSIVAEPTTDNGQRTTDRFAGVSRFATVVEEPVPVTAGPEPIAIIGMSGRFAESESLDAFWQHLSEGDNLVKPVSRWNPADCAMPGAAGSHCAHGSFIESIDRFDPAFFGISSVEAAYMDPQQRLFLEESWKALEDAGYAGKSVGEKQCGVYVGCGSSNYDKLAGGSTPPQAFWGNSQAVTPARIAYILNLQGPAISIDTACSSSLVAIHLACQGLWGRETEMALAGGVFLQPTPGFYQVANRAGMLSPEGKCRSFDGGADGFVPGEGVGVVVLKRLRDAIADGDHIHGVIAGSGINQDGKSNGLIAPNGRAQERLERSVYERFAIDPATIQVVEAHGTGTLLGDSIEYNAISRAFREQTEKKQFCAIGTVKTNIGHTSTAAGVAGVLKLLLSLKHRQIPPSLHFEKGNPAIDFESGPFYVNTQLRTWEVEGDATRRAAVSSFGFSGTNAHVIVEEAPAVAWPAIESPAYLVVLSARTAEQLKQQVQNLVAHLERTPVSMTDLSYSLLVGRTHLTHRVACVARDQEELVRLLQKGQAHTGEIQEGRVREQASLKKFGNYCIRECGNASNTADYVENLDAVAELYVQGYALDYPALFVRGARRIPLPTYPFARERHWVNAKHDAPIAEASERGRSDAAGEGARAPQLIQDDLAQIAAQALNVSSVSTDRVLMDLGFDSIGLTGFAKAINERYGLDITPVLFFDYPSISEIARYLTEEKGAVAKPKVRTAKATPVNEPIAIVGIAGVMPQSEDLEALWENLKGAKDLVTVIPEERWNWEDYYGNPLTEPNKSNSKWGGFMKEVDKFDPLFFGISPREAQMMDPQQRIFLETVWKAIEDSGQKVSDLSGTRTGVFVGVGSNDYIDILRLQADVLDGYTASGNSHSVLANRVSYLLNLRGPSAPIDTACSSSLVALHRAIESIHSGSCDMAIVGGVQVILSPGAYISFGMAGMLSPDGKCKTFDKTANGYVRGEGCGAMLLKPLSLAEADGNPIYGIIKATSENHGGRVTTMVAPNSAAQAALLVEAYEKAQIDPATVGYIECHGTGTSLGDPIEIQALSKAFSELYRAHGKAPAATPHCGLGTVKTNIGHLETAAGIAGVLKVLLALRHKEIPANLHFEELNPYIKLEGTPFYVVDQHTPWKAIAGEPRRAGVSSFGFGGANAHAVIEEYVPAERVRVAADQPQLIVLSAKNDDRLRAYVQSVQAYLGKHEVELVDLAYTLQVGRDEMAERLALVVSSTEELQQKLGEILAGGVPQGSWRGSASHEATVDAALIERRELSRLAERWVSGAKIDWQRLYEPGAAKRIPAPTYPFARERYWVKTVRKAVKQEETTLQSLVPVWNPARAERTAVSPSANVVLLGGDLDWVRQSYPNATTATVEQLADRSFDQLLWIAPESGDEPLIEQQEEGVLAVFRIVKALLQAGYGERKLQWTIITRGTQRVTAGDSIQPAHAGVVGLIGSLAKEYPNWDLRLLDVDSLASVTAAECLSLPWDKQGSALARRNGEWLRQETAATTLTETKPAYRQNGVYVVIGGAGGIGEVWTRFMIEQYQANVVWIGRRPQDAVIDEKIRSLGGKPRYIAADATDVASLEQARDMILKTYGAIHGVVHSALVLRDQSIARMDEASFRAGLAAKVDVSVNIDRVFGQQELDFLLFFSSIVSFVKPAGQSNYTAGCTFKDSFAQALQQRRPYPVKIMNWGYWGNVGVAADESHRRNMARFGLASIEPQEGMAALQRLMSSDAGQLALVKTIGKPTPVAKSGAATGNRQPSTVEQFIVEKLREELDLEAAVIRHDAPLTEYGVDSIVGVNLVRRIGEELQIPLEAASLFEHSTVGRLAEHIATNWQPQVAGKFRTWLFSTEQHFVAPLPDKSPEQLLDELVMQEVSLDDSYEKVTF